jgi:alpha-L-arabinofuranosidase
MTKKAFIGALLLSSCLGLSAKSVKAPSGGKVISDNLIGIFFEDISFSADGGLYADLVQNGSFEYSPAQRDGWGAGTNWKFLRPGHSAGFIEPRMDNTIHPNNPTYMRIHAERIGHYYDFDGWTGVGMQNEGFFGMNIKSGAKYNFSVFFRSVEGNAKKVRIVLATKQNKILAETEISTNGSGWQKYTAELTANDNCKEANLQILLLDKGNLDVDMVSLMPQDTYHGHGLRKDLAEALEALHPQFMRFPGGCVVHGGGDGFWDTYHWKNSVGPKEQRKAIKNTWGYLQSMGLGYFEYFQLCEDMKMEPVPILPCGVSCQGVNGGWSMKTQAQEPWPMDDIDRWAQDALDLIEWANGDASTKWGKVRADAGHPEPFNLKYIGIGNEEKITPEFKERFKYIYDKIRKAYPNIIIIGTAGPGSHKGNPDYENSWKFAEEIGLDIIDEHYYDSRQMFLQSRQYDNYPRNRKTKVYLGEYSVQERSHGNQLGDALAEALYLLHVERNGDIVCMTSYAPLFAYKNNTNWNPDLIYFDNEKPFFTCSYYVQKMFGESAGKYFYGNCVKFDKGDNSLIGQSVILNADKGEVYVKVCNCGIFPRKATIDLSRFGNFDATAERTVLSGNPDFENNYDRQFVKPKTDNMSVQKKMTIEVPANSFTMIKVTLK